MSTTLTEENLLALGELFDEAQEITDVDSFDPMPDGEYMCEVVLVEIKLTKETEKLMASWRFKVLPGEEGEGRLIFKNQILTDNPKNFKRFQNDLAKFDVIAADLPEMLAGFDSVADEYCLVQLKTDAKNRQWATIDVPEEG